jgi:hypothetical protein
MGVSGVGNMSDKKSSASGGIGFGGLLTIAFIILKLCKVINWSWVWVLSPIWISAGIFLLIVLFTILVAILRN